MPQRIEYPQPGQEANPVQAAIITAIGDVTLNNIGDRFGSIIDFGPGKHWSDFIPRATNPDQVQAVIEIAEQTLVAQGLQQPIPKAAVRRFLKASKIAVSPSS